MKHVKPINENWQENVKKTNQGIQNIKELLQVVYEDGVDNTDYDDEHGYSSTSFKDYWDKYGDNLITKYNLVEKEERHGNIREILATMKNLGFQWSNVAAQAIIKKLNVAELRDFKNWLKSVEGTIQSQKNKRW